MVRSQGDEEELFDILEDVDMIARLITARIQKGNWFYVIYGTDSWFWSAQGHFKAYEIPIIPISFSRSDCAPILALSPTKHGI